MSKKNTKYSKLLRQFVRFIIGLLLLFIVLVLFIRSPWGQDIIVGKLTEYVSNKTDTKVEIDRLFVTFSGNVFLEGLYLEDKKGDTLVYSKSLEANLALSPLIFGNSLDLKELELNGLRANINRSDNSENFNFNFLMEAFVGADTLATEDTSEPMQIDIGTIDLTDVAINYKDGYLGIESRMRLGKLLLEVDETDFNGQVFKVDKLEFSNSQIVYKQLKPFVAAQDSTETELPYLALEHLAIQNVEIDYNNLPENVLFKAALGDFLLELPKADLAKNEVEVDLVSLKNSAFTLKLPSNPTQSQDSLLTEATATNFEWPDYIITADRITLENNRIQYQSGIPEDAKKGFDANNISIFNLAIDFTDVTYAAKKANLELTTFSFKEQSGFHLKDFSFAGQINDASATVSDLKLKTNTSSVYGDLALSYPSLNEFITNPEQASVQLNIPNLNLVLQDALVFQPTLSENENFVKAAKKSLMGSISANGTLKALLLNQMQLDWGTQTSLSAEGKLFNLLELDSLAFDLKDIKASSTRKDLLNFVSEEELGISIPKTVDITAFAMGTINDIDADALLQIPEGRAQLAGNYSNQNQLQFDAILKVDSLQLNRLLKNEQLGKISFTMDAKGSGTEINSLNATLNSDFSQLELNGYDFSNLSLNGKIIAGKGGIDLSFKDDNLNLTSDSRVDLDSIDSNIKFNVNLIGADLFALGLMQENIKVGAKLNGVFKGNVKDFTLNASVVEGIAVYETEQYQLGELKLTAKIDETNTLLNVNSDFLELALKSNASPDQVSAALQRQFKGYFETVFDNDSIVKPVNATLDVILKPIPVLTEVFFRDVQQLDSITVHADFDAATRKMSAELLVPFARYNGSDLDSLKIIANGNATDFNFTAGFANLNSDPIYIKKTLFDGNLKNKELLLDFSSFDDNEKLVHIASEMRLAKDTVQLHINPNGLLFNKKKWSIPQDNQITIADRLLQFKNVILSRDSQSLELSNAISGLEKEHFGLTFDNFKLQTFLSLLNPDESLVSGAVNGSFILENPFEASGIVADFKINELGVLENPLGNLKLNATSAGLSEYDFNLSIKGGGLDLDFVGDYAAATEGASVDLDLALSKLDIKLVEELSKGSLKNGEGSISGNVKVTGRTDNPQYDGKFQFNKTSFNVASLNSTFKISDETLKLDNSGLYLDDFAIGDANANSFNIAGSILTKELLNPSFDLKLNADKFQLLNSIKEDNELFYGKASINADIAIKGDLKLPKIDGKLRIRDITEITYVVPESQLDVEERDGVVIFVNNENPEAILTRNDQEETPSLFRGFDANTILEIADDAVFNIIIDERTGDNLQVSGDAALNLSVEPNGRINLTGRYELNSGHYETSLYNLVKRKFEISPGSIITWQGDPTDAKLDVTAVYNVETSAEPLMSAVTSGEDISVTAKYRQVLPFLVYLNVDGELLKPELSFGLDMPEDEQGSLGGAVYSRVQQLNTQESELNKQVFSLLALNRFFPDSGSDGSGGGTAAIARDNVNRVLSGELNAFSDKVFGNSGFELDFDLDSFTDYEGDNPQDRTQLNINAKKKLFNDRLIVSAGSAVDVDGSAQTGQEETPIIGNVSLEYLLTKDGRFRLRGFRKNEYQNVIDGQLILTGVALIFNREFNKFSNLFNPLENKENLKSEKDKK